MRMSYGLSLQQQQKLIMTPQLRQAISLLQLPALELSTYIQRELLNNPTLELADEADEGEEAERDSADGEFDPEWIEYFSDSSDLGLNAVAPSEIRDRTSGLAQVPSLQEHLMFQLQLAAADDEEKKIGEYLIGCIDDSGYLRCGVEEAAARLKVDRGAVLHVLQIVQGFDPAGVGARDLGECLLIQLDYLGISDPLPRRVVADHLPDLADCRLAKIAEALGETVQRIQAVADLLRTLDPKPGRRFGQPGDVRYVVPEAAIEKVGGDFVVVLHDNLVPRLRISPLYRRLLARGSGMEADTLKYLEHKVHSAVWLMRSLEQRRLTLFRVVDTIARMQREFLDKGIRHLRPMTLRQVAASVNVHESTVSRAVANKYVQTPQGVFELRFFFTSGVGTVGGRVSAESIKAMIADLVRDEDTTRPLSDQEIVSRLQQRGINISRRTVAKYRDEAGIPPSGKRKRY